jgi:exosortase/archaeosortase family protein
MCPGDAMDKKVIMFLAKFFAIFAVLHTLIYLVDLSWLQNSIALFEAGLLQAPVHNSLILINQNVFNISASCTGLISSFILAAVVFSLKKPEIKAKVMLFAAGSALLFLVNLLRVYLVLLSAQLYGLLAATWLHFISWFVMSALIIGIWFYLTASYMKIKSFRGFL